jgi:O-antigen/teichoic acid export membrane protein
VTAGAAEERAPAGGLVKHGTLLFAASMTANATHYLFRILMSHNLSDADYAALDALLSLLMIISLPATAIQTVTAKYTSDLNATGQHAEIVDLFLRSLRRIGVVCVIGLTIFLVSSGFIADYLRINQLAPVVLMGITLFSGMPLPAAAGVLQGLQRFVVLGLMGIGGALTRLIAGVVLVVLLGLGVSGAILASFFSSFVSFAIFFVPLRPFLRRSSEVRADSSEIYRYFAPVILFLFCQSLLSFVDAIVVKRYFDPEQAAVYFRAAIVGKAFLYLPTALALVLFPKASELYALRESSFRLLIQAILYTLGVAVAGMAVCLLFAGPLAVIVGGGHTPEVAGLIRYFGLAVTPVALLQLLISHAMAVHRTSALYPLAAGTLAFIGVLFAFHETLRQVLIGMGVAGCGLCVLCIVWTWMAERQEAHA